MGPVAIVLTTVEAVRTAVKVEKKMSKIVDVLKSFGAVAALVPVVGAEVAQALADGSVTPEEAEKVAIDAAASLDLKIKVHGVDCLTPDAQALIARGLAIVAVNAYRAEKA